jgi:hypothetical protein
VKESHILCLKAEATADPSLRLKNGYGQDDTTQVVKERAGVMSQVRKHGPGAPELSGEGFDFFFWHGGRG